MIIMIPSASQLSAKTLYYENCRYPMFPLRADLSRAIGFSQWYYHAKNNFVLKVVCDDGIVGWGECYGPNLAIAASVEHHFKPLLIGKDPLQNEVLWNFMWCAYCDFNRHGIFMAAISGIDIALWDIKGKALIHLFEFCWWL